MNMQLIDLSDCRIDDENALLKKESLKAFVSSCDTYDLKKISIKLGVSIAVVKQWIVEVTPSKFHPLMKIDEKVRILKLENPKFSQRDIAKYFKISVGAVNKYLKNLEV